MKKSTLTISLTEEQVQTLQVMALKANNNDWKEFAKDEFDTYVLKSKVAKPRISTSGITGTRVSSPSTDKFYDHTHF